MRVSRRVGRLEAAAESAPECRCAAPRFARVRPDGTRPVERCPRCGLPRPVIWVRHAPDWLMPGGPPGPAYRTPVRPLAETTLFVLDPPARAAPR